MSSMSSVAGLSKYITSLPKIQTSVLIMVVISFVSGVIYFLINPIYGMGFIEQVLYGGGFGFFVLAISSIISGVVMQHSLDNMHGLNFKIKHTMFLSLVSMTFLSIVLIAGGLFEVISGGDFLLNIISFGCILVFGINTLILGSVSKIGFSKSAMVAILQPLLVIATYIIFSFLCDIPIFGYTGVGTLALKFIVGSIILILAIYSFVRVIESPMKKNLGIGVLDLLSLFLYHMNEGSNSLESLFEHMGESITTIVSFASFKKKNSNEIKSLFVSPCVHPGPLGDIGGGNMPTILANEYDNFTMIAHGPSTHDFNPVAVKEIDKIKNAINHGLEKAKYSSKASKFRRYEHESVKIGVQFFNEGLILLSTFAPNGSDDIEFGVGLSMMAQSKSKCQVKDSVIVDCHNSFTPESGEVLPGNNQVFEIIDVIDKIEMDNEYSTLKVGCSHSDMGELDKTNGIGQSGLKTMVVEVDNQRTAYVLFDSNNMEIGFRQEIIDKTNDLNIDYIEVMTTDTHYVNTLSRGYNPIGINEREKIIEFVKESIEDAISDLEEVEVATGTEKIENLKTFGPNNSTELISTISSIVAVSKIAAPVLFLSALLILFIWIFYTGV